MTGCTEISPGCDHCYARQVAETRLRDAYLRQPTAKVELSPSQDPFAPRFWRDRLEQPLRWKRPRRIFVNSMSDVFHADFSFAQIAAVFDVIARAHWHRFQVLTKRPLRPLRYAARLPWPANLWLGVSIETMAQAERANTLRQIPAACRFVSAEPLLGDLRGLDLAGIHWLIIGGESGPGCRPYPPGAVHDLIIHASHFPTAVFVKQLGGHPDKRGDPERWPPELRIRNFPA